MIPYREEDTNFKYFLNVDAPPFELNGSTGFSPGLTNDSKSFESPMCMELDNVKQDKTVTSPKTQFLVAIKDLTPSKEKSNESTSHAPRPILGKEFSVAEEPDDQSHLHFSSIHQTESMNDGSE